MIKINNLCFSYNSKPPYALDNVSINIPKGAYVSIIGPNGSCKTTLVKLILNQLKPCLGSIDLDYNKIGYVPQKVDSFNSQFSITVKEVLSCHASVLKLKDKSIIDKALSQVKMENFKNNLIGSLSGGQQQKIFIARALMGCPDLLILDELSTGVDHKSQKEIYSLIKNLNETLNITILSVEHNLKMALEYSTHILELFEGDAKFYTVEEYKNLINKNNIFLTREEI
ncbi:metal ABC transporter ATP-binding protein [Clostridium fallax]|uniref:Zinc transport system ATP-binding protein n=1 Tax=Clostridium fallax TaxID=1533 RepID=A0A1M4Y8E8_9CLOT|nr:metal ABC transporter ATP-binding protein [Clostridium fallax]SHF01995.1 zinc transport system ATP-binding protein [Clostridium fallax]SQB06021.1 zinc ABC transporter ATP-binding protein [Clostridium fallax]